MTVVRLTVAYDGRGFSGFAPNAGVATVGGTLAEAIERVVGHPVTLACAGRTDRGVHAWGQVVSFEAGDGFDLAGLQRSINAMCGPAVVVRDVAEAPAGFDARFSATARRYRYLVLNRPVPDPFLAATTWHVDQPLRRFALELACDPVIGTHDFAAFCRRPRPRDGSEASLVRRVVSATWHDDGDGILRFEIEASAFCHQMVRSLVGTMVDMGRGRRRPGDMAAILRSRDRRFAGDLAPPHGLTLLAVRYP